MFLKLKEYVRPLSCLKNELISYTSMNTLHHLHSQPGMHGAIRASVDNRHTAVCSLSSRNVGWAAWSWESHWDLSSSIWEDEDSCWGSLLPGSSSIECVWLSHRGERRVVTCRQSSCWCPSEADVPRAGSKFLLETEWRIYAHIPGPSFWMGCF